MSRGALATKRCVDVVLGSLLLLLVLPVILIGTVGCAIAFRSWPFFSQVRIGKDGTPFRIFKLRTLPKDFPAYAPKCELGKTDIPWVGRTLRALHLDELPQLALVVAGKMSLVGPRPEMAHLHETFDPGFAKRRSSVRPGCTGAWQISNGCHGMIDEHPEFDEFYVSHQSVRLDLWIMLRSLRLVLPFGRPRLVSFSELAARVNEPVPVAVAVDDFVPARARDKGLQSVEA